MALAKEKHTNVESVVYVGEDGNDAIAYIYDYNVIYMKSSTTFDRLAQDELGDPSLGTLIAYYNNIQNEHEVSAGTKIKIPILVKNDKNQHNRIYARPDMQDAYGRDIAIGEDGGFAVSDGDFGIVSGPENIAQAMGNRFASSSEKRIRMGVYGIRNSIGDAMAINSYLLSSIEQTTKEDPRIKEIKGISFKGKEDSLYISICYTDSNDNQDTYMGKI
jgi:hypothetical protein